MANVLQRLDQEQVSELAITIRNAGIAGAGGAGFPTYAKWQRIDEVDALLVNHQESEPNYYMDKWLGRQRAEDLASLFEALLESTLEVVVVAAKEIDRELMGEFEAALDPAIYLPSDLPVEDESGIVIAYTEDRYQLGMESVLLNLVCDTVIGQDLPMDHGWIVQNTESLIGIYDALVGGEPMTSKFVHVDGHVPRHRFLEVPIGTPATALLEAAGTSIDELPSDRVLADGGPGWCFEIETSPEEFGVRKRTNCLLVLDEDMVETHTFGDGRIDVREGENWKRGAHESEPTSRLEPSVVRVPLRSNPSFEGIVERSRPIVGEGETVARGEMIAVPAPEGISNAQHAPMDGTVIDVGKDQLVIERLEWDDDGRRTTVEPTDRLYWTWCMECGIYVIPEASVLDPTTYVCEDCR